MRSVTETVEVMRAALVEARAVILTVISNAMILESDYDPSQHPVIKQIDAALAKAKEQQFLHCRVGETLGIVLPKGLVM